MKRKLKQNLARAAQYIEAHRIENQDIPALYDRFKQLQALCPAYTLKDYALKCQLEESVLFTKFEKIRQDEQRARIKTNFLTIAEEGSAKVLDGVRRANPRKEYGEISKVTAAAADRVGFTPAAATVQVTQAVQVNLPPLFDAADAVAISAITDDKDLYPPVPEVKP